MEETNDDDADFVSQGVFEIAEADGLLERLKTEGIRFEIEVEEVHSHPTGFTRMNPTQTQVKLYIHKLDLKPWEALREKLYPV
jgi:hypothetical protein